MNELNDEGNGKVLDENMKKAEMQFIKVVRKKKRDTKIGLFLNDFKSLTLIEQQPKTNLVVCHTDHEFDLINGKQKNYEQVIAYKKIFDEKFSLMKGIYFGTFLSKFIHRKTFNNAHSSGKKLLSKILDIFSKQQSLPIDPDFYIISIKTKETEKKLGKDVLENKREVSFVLDCVSKLNGKMNEYNPLHDKNLKIYFNSYQNRKNLKKMGFINNHGFINPDPDFRFLGGPLKNKNLKNQLERNQNKLASLKDKSNKLQGQLSELCLMKLPELSCIPQDDINKLSHDFVDKPRLLKLPAIDKKWDGHPLLIQNMGGRALSLDNIKHKNRPNNDVAYEHLSKIIKNSPDNSKIKQNISRILSPPNKKKIIQKDKKKYDRNTTATNKKEKDYDDIIAEINAEVNKNIDSSNTGSKNNIEKKIKANQDSSKIQYQKKNNVMLNKTVIKEKKEDSIHDVVFDTEVEEKSSGKGDSSRKDNSKNASATATVKEGSNNEANV